MSLIVSASAGSTIEPIEAGTYTAVCYGLIDLGEQYSETYDKWTRKVMILWELPGEKIDLGGDEPVSRTISKMYTSSLSEKAKLRVDLQAWRGRPFTTQELAAFDLHAILGVPCLLNIQHREYKERTFAEIAGIVKMPKGMPVEPATLDPIAFDLDTDDLGELEKLPKWIEERIKTSRTYENRVHPHTITNVSDLDDLERDAARAELFDRAEQMDASQDEDVPF